MSLEEVKNKLIEFYSAIKIRKTSDINSATPDIMLKEKKNLEKLSLEEILNYITSTIDILIELKAIEKYEEKIENDEKNKLYKNNTNNSKEDENGLILYEGMLIKAERDIRNHIKIEQELKLKIEDQEFEIEDLKKLIKENENNNNILNTVTNRTLNTIDNNMTNNIAIINNIEKSHKKSIKNSIDIKKHSSVASNSKKKEMLSSTAYPMFKSSNDFNINLINQLKKENARLRKMLINFELNKNDYFKYQNIQNPRKKVSFGSFNNKLSKANTKNVLKEKSNSKNNKSNLNNKISLKVKCKDYIFTEKNKKDLSNTTEKNNLIRKITPKKININKLQDKLTPTDNKNNININNSIKFINNGILIFKKVDDVKKTASKKQININFPNNKNLINTNTLNTNSFIINRNIDNNKNIKKIKLNNEIKTDKLSTFNSLEKDNVSLQNNSNSKLVKILINKKNGLSHRSTSNAISSQRNEKQKSMYHLIKNNFINHKANNTTFYEHKVFNNYISIKNNSKKLKNNRNSGNKETMIFKKMQVPFANCRKLEIKGVKGRININKMNINITEGGYIVGNETSNRFSDSLNEQ